jgi:hypothetical protein
MLGRIKLMDKNSLIVVAGDLNRIGLERCQYLEKEFLLTQVISREQPKHKKGNPLANVWTNIPGAKAVLKNGLDDISDHFIFMISARIGEDVKRTLPYKPTSYYTPKYIRKALESKENKETLKEKDSLDKLKSNLSRKNYKRQLRWSNSTSLCRKALETLSVKTY